MNFMEEINKETQAMLKQISIRKAKKNLVIARHMTTRKAHPMRTMYEPNLMTKKQKILWCINEIIYLVFNVDFNEYKPTKL